MHPNPQEHITEPLPSPFKGIESRLHWKDNGIERCQRWLPTFFLLFVYM